MFGVTLWTKILVAYLLIGAAIVFLTSFRTVIIRSITPAERISQPKWKLWVFYILTFSVSLIAYPLFISGWRKERQSVLYQLQENAEFRGLSNLYTALSELSNDGVDTDEIPGASGTFGFDVTNPIPIHTTFGSISYLRRLRTMAGEEVESERIGSFGSPITEMPVDGYQLSTVQEKDLGVIYLSPYHKRTSAKAPDGFTLTNNA